MKLFPKTLIEFTTNKSAETIINNLHAYFLARKTFKFTVSQSKDDNNIYFFSLSNLVTFSYNGSIVINGNIIENNNGCIIQIYVQMNVFVLLFFYIYLFIVIIVTVPFIQFPLSKMAKFSIGFFIFIIIFMYGVISYFYKDKIHY